MKLSAKSAAIILFALIAPSLLLWGAAKKTAWEEDGLKGKVKEMKIMDYAIDDKGTKSLNSTTTVTYDARGSRKSQVEKNEGAQTYITSYQYDKSGSLVHSQRSVEDSPVSVADYKYDKTGRLIEVDSKDMDGRPTKTTYQYDKAGNLIKVSSDTAGEGNYISAYKYDASGRITEETGGADESTVDFIKKYTYDDKGVLVDTKNANADGTSSGVSEAWEYDASGFMVQYTTTEKDAVNSKTVWKNDGTGNKVQESIYNVKAKKETLVQYREYSYTYY